jgi:beta-glucanase (GH16 family)
VDNGAQFDVVVTDAASSVTSRTAVLTVTPNAVPPSINSEPASSSVKAGQAATFSVTASGTAPLSYQWNRNGTPVSGATSAVYTTPATTLADNGAQFNVIVKDPVGSVNSSIAVLSVTAALVPPSITSQPVSSSVTAGQTATFSVTASGTAPLSYQWMKNGQSIAGATSATYTTSATTTSDNGSQFIVHVSNAAGNATSNAASLTVNALAGQLASNITSLTFGNVNVGSTSTQNATLKNIGNSPLTISTFNLSGAGFNASGVPEGLVLSPGQTATLTVTFVPNVSGGVTGSVTITSDAANSPTSIALTGTGVQTNGQTTPPPQAAGYILSFSDDFNALNVSPNSLGNYPWYQGLWWEQTVAPLSDFSVSNSILTLNWVNGQGTSTANLCTTAKDASNYQAWRYGYFEARMAWANTTAGAWPAFWLIPVEDITGADVINGVRDSGEIDVMEGQGGSNPNTVYGTIHEWKNNADAYNNDSTNAYNAPSGVDLSQYHTYGVLWTPGTISWYFDNQLIHSANTTAIFDQQSFYLVLSSQEGVNWSGGNLSGVTATTIPLNVDWVHVWQKP